MLTTKERVQRCLTNVITGSQRRVLEERITAELEAQKADFNACRVEILPSPPAEAIAADFILALRADVVALIDQKNSNPAKAALREVLSILDACLEVGDDSDGQEVPLLPAATDGDREPSSGV